MLKGFRNFLMRGDVIVVAVGLIVALAFNQLVTAFTANLINPLVNRLQSPKGNLGVQLGDPNNTKTFMDFGAFISAVIYFAIFMAVVYFAVVTPYRFVQARRGHVVFGDQPPVKTCPACLSDDLPVAATKCKYCGTGLELPSTPSAV